MISVSYEFLNELKGMNRIQLTDKFNSIQNEFNSLENSLAPENLHQLKRMRSQLEIVVLLMNREDAEFSA